MIDDMLAHATPAPAEGPILAAVAPHAGYPYLRTRGRLDLRGIEGP